MPLKKKMVIIGAGGHAKVIIDILQSSIEYEIVGLLDKNRDRTISNLNVLGDDSLLPSLYKQGIHYAFIAIGDNRIRVQLAKRATNIGFKLINAISPFAYISPSAILGSGIAIMAGSVINASTQIENNTIINTGATIDHDCFIGDSCNVSPGCTISGNVTIGNGTFVGTGAKVIDGVNIGAWSIIGAGAVIIDNIPENCLAVGIPARIKKYLR